MAHEPVRFVSYLRVSTQRQNSSGLGIEAQREAVRGYMTQHGGELLAEYREAESGRKDDRPELRRAMRHAEDTGATLIVAKLDRLARSASFLLTVMDGVSNVAFCDFPQIPPGPAGRFMLTTLAAVAEMEAGLISERTKAALAAAKARGVKLGNPNLQPGTAEAARLASEAAKAKARNKAVRIKPYIDEARENGAKNFYQIARALEKAGVRTPGGCARWSETQVSRVLQHAR